MDSNPASPLVFAVFVLQALGLAASRAWRTSSPITPVGGAKTAAITGLGDELAGRLARPWRSPKLS